MITSDQLTQKEKDMLAKDLNEKNIIKEDDAWYYNDTSFVTNSHLKVLLEGGPEALAHYYKYGSEDKPAYAFGRAFHTLILEPEEFNSRYFILDDTKIREEIGGARPTTTKKYAAWLETQQKDIGDKEVLDIKTMNVLEAMETKLLSIPQVVALLENTAREVIYKGNFDNVPVKGKMDAVKPNRMIIDLKTTSSAPTPYEFGKTFRNYNYDRQMAFYAELADVPEACIIAIQKTKPYTVGVYMVSAESMNEGRDKFMRAIDEYKGLYLDKDVEKFYYQGSL